jgi:plasmid stability protein
MPDLLIRDVDPAMVERLKAQAKRNGRSMQAEAREILEKNVQMTMAEWLERMAELTKDDPPWQPGDPTVAELIREERDEREAHLYRVIFGEDSEGESGGDHD